MHVANAASSASAASFCHFANTGNKRSGAARRVGETLWGWGWKGRGGEKEENWTRQRKERKDRILEGGARKGENFKEGEEGRGKEMRE